MIAALTDITIYKPFGAKQAYLNPDDSSTLFPVTDACERCAKLMGDDYVKLSFNLASKVVFDAFSYIEYNGQTFFLKEQYIPTPNGTFQGRTGRTTSYFTYAFKFVSVGNMLSKHTCFRHVVVGSTEFDEPEIDVSANLDTIYDIIIGSIPGAIMRLESALGYYPHYCVLLESIYNNGYRRADGSLTNSNIRLTAHTELETFSFSGDTIADVCTTVANTFTDDDKDTEWYITEDNGNLMLHFAKCVSSQDGGADVLDVNDYTMNTSGVNYKLQPYTTGGLKSASYTQERTDIPQVLLPYGSDRNMSYASVKGVDEVTQLQATYGKRLRLKKSTTYTVTDKDGTSHTITTDADGAIHVNGVNTGIEKVLFFEDVYPQCHIKVTSVSVRNKKQDDYIVPEYTIEGVAVDETYSNAYLTSLGVYPIKIEEGQTLSIRFESGFLNGREFEVANKTIKDQGVQSYSLKVTIVADGSIEDGTLIPSGNFIPKVGDEFALFNMKMPESFIEMARQDLAQKAYEKLCDIQDTRPEVKCVSDPTVFDSDVYIGRRTIVRSEQFSGLAFSSRIISYSYKLPTPSNVTFNLASAVMRGTISTLQETQAHEAMVDDYLTQKSKNLSRRGWRDASEMADMLNSLAAELMLVGNERTQFSLSCNISCVNDEAIGADGLKHFSYLKITNGQLIHTQDPYISYANKGVWNITNWDLDADENQNDLDENTPYYLYAIASASSESAEMVLRADAIDDAGYLLVGTLSSEFVDGNTSYRVLNRTNGYSMIAGGTITTEQVQDPNRNLIIDYLNQRIIARNGAEIIGNIKFLSADGHSSSGGFTSVNGGLLLSEIIQLMSENVVTAGMSGRSTDNVLFWGGGTYEEANEGTDSVTTLITKSGTGRIGCFRVVDKDTIAVVSNQSVLYITNKPISSFAPFDSYSLRISGSYETSTDAINKNFNKTVTKDLDVPVGNYEILFPKTSVQYGSYAEDRRTVEGDISLTDCQISFSLVVCIIKKRFTDNIINPNDTTRGVVASKNLGSWSGIGTTLIAALESFTLSFRAEVGDAYAIQYRISGRYSLTTPSGWEGHAYCEVSHTITLSSADKMCVYGSDGIAIINRSNISFKVYNNDTADLKLIMNGLPNSSEALESGQLYAENGVIKIK